MTSTQENWVRVRGSADAVVLEKTSGRAFVIRQCYDGGYAYSVRQIQAGRGTNLRHVDFSHIDGVPVKVFLDENGVLSEGIEARAVTAMSELQFTQT